MKFANLFPEIKPRIEAVLQQSSNIRNPDAELQQRSVEYLKLSQIASADVLATVLEEMPRMCHSYVALRRVALLYSLPREGIILTGEAEEDQAAAGRRRG